MTKMNIVIEDCYAGTVNVINVDKTGITYSVDDVTCCYSKQRATEGQQTLKWEDDGWYITDLWETVPVKSVATADERFEEVREALDGDDYRNITRAFGAYLKELDEAEEDRCSGDPRREQYALTEERCLEKAVALALA